MKKRKKMKRGVINLPLVLIISISILAISGIAYLFFSNSFGNLIPSEKSETLEETSINLKINNVYEYSGSLVVDVGRGLGEGELTGIRFILSTGSHTETINLDSNMAELEARNFVLTPTQLSLSEIKNVFIIPIFKFSEKKEIVGKITSQYILNSNVNPANQSENSIVEEACIPNCINMQCGLDSTCGQSCGTCDATEICSNGICVSQSQKCVPDSNATTCSSAKCGTKINNCGQQVSCGICNSGTCTNGVCVPKTCISNSNTITCGSAKCGTKINNCGQQVSCGICNSGTCTNGVCVIEQTCVPKSCLELGKNCGNSDNGCGTSINCGTCSGTYTCTNNICTPPSASSDKNIKDLSKYAPKEVFLVSDEDWKQVLVLIPTVVWTNEDASVTKYPLFIYHKENNAFDIDSIFNFAVDYNTGKISYFGSLPAELSTLLQNNFNIEQKQNVLSYWKGYKDIVYVEDNYRLALLASTYASLINAPLVIKGYNDNLAFTGRNIICVGNPASNCNEKYSSEQLQQKYMEKTNTDKIILTNTNLDIYKSDKKTTVYSRPNSIINNLFGKTSLMAPYLASSKKELIIPVSSTDIISVNNELKNSISRLNFNPQYLTILASPLEIQQTIVFPGDDGEENTWSIDSTKYGNMDDDPFGFAELKVGRIYGFSTSDVSSYVARISFYSDLYKPENLLFIGQGVGASDTYTKLFSNIFNSNGYNSVYRIYSDPTQPDDWADKILINDDAHGSPYYSTIQSEDIPDLENPVILTASCLTCAFDELIDENYGRLFCLQLLRKGAIGIIASVDTAGFNWDSTRLNGALNNNLGTVFKTAQNFNHARGKWYIEDLAKTNDYRNLQADIQFLLGDPTFKPTFNRIILPETSYGISADSNLILIDVTINSININDGSSTYVFIEGTDDFVQAKYAKFFLKIPVTLFDSYNVESSDVRPLFFGGIKVVATQDEFGKKYAYFLIEKDLSSNPPNQVTNNKIRIRITKKVTS